MPLKTIVFLLSTKEAEIIQAVNESATKTLDRPLTTSNNLLELLGLVLILVFILAVTYITTRFIGRYKQGQLKSSNFQVIDTYRISQNKMLQLVRIGDKYIVIAISKDQITYMTEIDETQVIFREDKTLDKQSFKQVFEYFRNKK